VPTFKLYLDNFILVHMDSIHMGTVPSKMALCRTLFNPYPANVENIVSS